MPCFIPTQVTVHSFVLVASISYLLEVANFFVPDQKMSVEWKSDEPDVRTALSRNGLRVFIKINAMGPFKKFYPTYHFCRGKDVIAQ